MTQEQMEDTVYQFRLAIDRATAKHRREHVNSLAGEEYLECWAKAIIAANPGIMQPRKAGRPRKEVIA